MSMPRSEGWYDDPDGSDAERYFDGQQWTPRRRRKEPAPKRSSRMSDPYGSGFGFPSTASGPYDPPASAGPSIPYDAYPPPAPPGSYGPPPSGPPPSGPPPQPGSTDPYGSVPTYGYPRQPALYRLGSTMTTGINRTLGLLLAGVGLALVATAFMPWGQIREVDHSDGGVFATTLSFPGLGEPRVSATVSDGPVSGTLNVNNNPLFQLHNTNPGWIALLLGVAAVATGAALLWAPQQRNIVAVAVAVLGGVAGLLCIFHLFDLRAAFGNPPNLADDSFSPGVGLIAACALSFAVTALGVWAYVAETRSGRLHY
jgi:hypothetical protein